MKYKDFVDMHEAVYKQTKLGAVRGDIVKLKKYSWVIFKVYDDYHYGCYKANTAKRKLYELKCIAGKQYGVWEVNGMGKRTTGDLIDSSDNLPRFVKRMKRKKKHTIPKDASSLPAGFSGFGFD